MMIDHVKMIFGKQRAHIGIADIHGHQVRAGVDVFFFAAREIIHDRDVMARADDRHPRCGRR